MARSAFAVSAALVFGMAVLIGSSSVPAPGAGALIAVAVAAVGAGLSLLPGVPLGRAIGTGLLVFGVHLLGVALTGVAAPRDRAGVALLLTGLTALAALGLAVTRMRVWLVVAGVLVPVTAVAAFVPAGAGRTGVSAALLVVAVLFTAVVVAAPRGAAWGDLAGAAAATAATFAFGAGSAPVGALFRLPWVAFEAGPPPHGLAAAAFLVAVVLVLLAVARRDPATGLLAALVVTQPAATSAPVVLPVLVPVAVVALVAVRVPAVRSALAAVPVALRRGSPPAARAAAWAAAVAAAALVAATLPFPGVPALVALVVAGPLAHFLPTGAGSALAVVAMVGLALARPWHHLVAEAGVAGALAFLTAVAAIWPLTRRHPTPAVLAAAAYLLLVVLPRAVVLDGAPVVALLFPLVLLGVPSAVLAVRPRTAPGAQAVGAVVLGAAVLLPAAVSRPVASGPLVPTLARDLTGGSGASTAVVLTLVALVFALVVSTAWRPSAPLAVAAALTLHGVALLAVRHLAAAAVDVVVGAFLVSATALAAASWFAGRRPAGSGDRLADR
jgi:hypothetical protein